MPHREAFNFYRNYELKKGKQPSDVILNATLDYDAFNREIIFKPKLFIVNKKVDIKPPFRGREILRIPFEHRYSYSLVAKNISSQIGTMLLIYFTKPAEHEEGDIIRLGEDKN